MKNNLIQGKNCQISSDFIFTGEVTLANNVRIDDNVEFNCKSIHVGDNTHVFNDVNIKGGSFYIDSDCKIRPFARFNVKKKFELGKNSKIGCYWNISGREIKIGENLWCVDGDFFGNGIIGGGSCFDVHSKLEIGNNCHLGLYTYINTARPVIIGNNVGFGFRSIIWTHGAWQNVLEGYSASFAPVTIGDNAWIPTNIQIMPGVSIGEGSTIGSGSIVTKDIPNFCLAVGVPVKIIRNEKEWPKKLSIEDKNNIMQDLLRTWKPFIEDEGFKITESNNLEKSLVLKFSFNSEKFQLIYFVDNVDDPKINYDKNTIILTFDNNFNNGNADQIFYLQSYQISKNKENKLGSHVQNFMRRRGIKFVNERI